MRVSPLILCLGFTLIAACKPPPKVAVEERDVMTVRQETERLGGQLIRIVQPGDTLYSISFVAGVDVNKLAAWNGIRDTSKLGVGQRIRLTEPLNFKPQVVVARKSASKSTGSQSVARSTKSNRSVPEPSATTAGSENISITQPKVKKTASTSLSSKPKPASSNSVADRLWRWPTDGTLVGKFTAGRGHQGIDIRTTRGESVIASKAGEVVYVGNSLKGYGNLVIVKHDEEFLSAYAHNQDIYVREGQTVNARQKIATVGLNNQRVAALHFQIRREGKPVDPLKYLPVR